MENHGKPRTKETFPGKNLEKSRLSDLENMTKLKLVEVSQIEMRTKTIRVMFMIDMIV